MASRRLALSLQMAAPLPADPPSIYSSILPSSLSSPPFYSVFVASLSSGRWLFPLRFAIMTLCLRCTSGNLMSHRLIAHKFKPTDFAAAASQSFFCNYTSKYFHPGNVGLLSGKNIINQQQ